MYIERITQSTVSSTVSLFNAYRKFYQQAADEQGSREFLEERIANDESIIFTAFMDEKPAGFVQLYPVFSSVALQKAYILNDLYVDERYRKQGIAKSLIETSYQFCQENHARYITLETAADNHHAQQLYEKMGMKLDEVLHYTKAWE